MRHDLVEVLRNPFRYMAEKGRHALADPRAIPSKAFDYAKYDIVRVMNQLVDRLGLNEGIVERTMARIMAMPAERFLRMKRSVNLLVSDRRDAGPRAPSSKAPTRARSWSSGTTPRTGSGTSTSRSPACL